jgi:hypothetical protein
VVLACWNCRCVCSDDNSGQPASTCGRERLVAATSGLGLHGSAVHEIAKRCKIGVPSEGFSHARNHFSHSSLQLPVLWWQTILSFEKKRRQRLVPPLYDASKPLSLRGLR